MSCVELQPKRDSGTLHEKKIRLSMGDEHFPGNTCTCARSSHGPSVRTSRRVFHSIRNSPGLKGEFSTGTKDIRRIVGGTEVRRGGGVRGLPAACSRGRGGEGTREQKHPNDASLGSGKSGATRRRSRRRFGRNGAAGGKAGGGSVLPSGRPGVSRGTRHGQEYGKVMVSGVRGVGRAKSLASCPDIQGPSFVTSLLNLSKASN